MYCYRFWASKFVISSIPAFIVAVNVSAIYSRFDILLKCCDIRIIFVNVKNGDYGRQTNTLNLSNVNFSAILILKKVPRVREGNYD